MLSTSRAAPAGRQRTISAQEAASGARRECRTFRRCTPPRDARFCRSTAVGLRVSDPIGIIIRTPHRRARAHNERPTRTVPVPSHSLFLLSHSPPSGPARLSQHKSSAVGQMVNSALDNGCDWHHHRGAHGSQQQQEVVEDSENEGATQSKSPGPSMRSVHRVAQGCARITPSNRQRNETESVKERKRERRRAHAAHRIRRQRGR